MAWKGQGTANKLKARRRREAFLEHARAGHTREECLAHVGWGHHGTYLYNRKNDRAWARDVDVALGYETKERNPNSRSAGNNRVGGPPNKWKIQVYGQKDNFLEAYKSGLTIGEACAKVGWTNTATYRKWRTRDAQFAKEVDDIKAARILPGAHRDAFNEQREAHGKNDLWTPEHGFLGFRKTFLGHDSPWFHLQAIEAIHDMIGSGAGNDVAPVLLILWPPGHGKLVGLSELVPTPDGWMTVAELDVGSELFAADGSTTRITAITEPRTVDAYRVHFADGHSIDVGADHRWFVWRRDRSWKRRGEGARGYCTEVIDTDELFEKQEHLGRPNFSIPVADAIELPDVDLPVDPYVLGAWLGDGSSSGGEITCPEDPEIAERVAEHYVCSRVHERGGRPYVWGFLKLRPTLRRLGVLNNKHIPQDYLRASIAQRTALLHGLMDTDGSCSRGQCEFTNMNERLVDGVEELLWSLGIRSRRYKGTARYNGVEYGTKHRLSFYASTPVFSLERKVSRQGVRRDERMRRRVVTRVERIPDIVGRCWQVDHPDRLFAAGRSFVVSHNSSLYEDYDIFRIATDPGVRITIGSEKLTQAKKFLSLVRDKLDNGAAGMELLHKRFGPFAPQPRKPGAKQRVARQRWGSDAFDVYKKPRGREGQRDPTMQALGMGSGITGTRTNILQVDDPQSRENLRKKGNTEGLVDSFRQDWLSRPLADGITVILMNRVGEGDFPQYLMEETSLVDRVIKVKAWDPARGGWAWPERYSQEFYLGKRKQVGEDAWQRNYQQVGLANRDATFTDKLIAQSRNKLRSVMHPVPRPPSGLESEIVITLDPGQFKASFQVFAFHPDRLLSLDLRLLENAKSYGVFGDVVDELCQQFHRPGLSVVTTVIIETKAFQYGLVTDPVMVDASRRWGFQIIPFQTGKEKNDPDFGVPRIARMMEHHEIDFPDSDQPSRERYEALYRQLRRWRPGVLGKVLEMDHVMTTYFGSHHWNLRRRTIDAAMNASAFNFGRR